MKTLLSGSCLCGAVQYSTSSTPAYSGNCHCRDCQKATGSAFAANLMVPETEVEISGAVRYHETRADSGRWVDRGFCPVCGSHLFGKLEIMPGMLFIRAGTLDDPASYKPALDFFTASAAPWDPMDPALPKFPRSPPAS